MSYVVVPQPQRSPFPYQILAALTIGLVLFLSAAGGLTGSLRIVYSGRILPGISVAGVDLSSRTPDQAVAALEERITYPESGQVVFRYGDEVWVAHPQELGLVFDVGASVEQAYRVGRGGLFSGLAGQVNALQGGWDLAPVIVFDERVAHGYLQNLAMQIDRTVVETELSLNGTEVLYTPGQTGRVLDVDATLEVLATQLKTFADGEVPLVIEEQVPALLDASAQAEALRQALSAPLTLIISDAQPGDPGPWTLEPTLVAGMLTVGRAQTDTGWQYEIALDTRSIEQFLEQVAPQVNRTPQNARFYFDDNTRQLVLIEPALVGRTLDIGATQDAVTQGLLLGQHEIPLALDSEDPEVGNDDTAQALGITELVYAETTYFRGSSAARLQNIETSAAQFHGLLVPPNATFSMGDVLGDISLDNGYAEALIIYNGRTITGVGGGVCQVSTTLFRTAFFAGYPIVERHAHAFRVFYYEQRPGSGTDPALAGLDATVYFPLVDLKFTNDRPYWLLMETYFNPIEMSLTWKFYSTNDGRTVQWQNLGLRNVVPAPEPLFEENADLAPETCLQVDYPADGADITVTRMVYDLNGKVLFSDNIQTQYEAWQAVYQYGPGTEDPAALVAQGSCNH
ncbi:MAG: VanW family protein [Chloroflexi bacterium]|nr:VanW family protein [Chloroflexota bacterium]